MGLRVPHCPGPPRAVSLHVGEGEMRERRGTMRNLSGRTQAAVLSGSLVFAGGVPGRWRRRVRGPPTIGAARERWSWSSRRKRRESEAPQPVAAEVKALMVTGTVMAIDREARSVVLRDDLSGEEFTVLIPADATTLRPAEGRRPHGREHAAAPGAGAAGQVAVDPAGGQPSCSDRRVRLPASQPVIGKLAASWRSIEAPIATTTGAKCSCVGSARSTPGARRL